jgi:serine/threonine protein kinase
MVENQKQTGKWLANFQLLNQLGETGGFGTVYRAIDSSNGEGVAVKIFKDLSKKSEDSFY